MPATLIFSPDEQAFINQALSTIERNPLARINAPAKEVLNRMNFVFDAHSHIFDGKCVDADYVIVRMLHFEDNPLAKKLVQFIVRRLMREHIDEYQGLSADQLLETIYEKKAGTPFTANDLSALESPTGQDAKLKIKVSVDWIGLRKRIKEVLAILKNGEMRFVYDYFEGEAVHNHIKGKELLSIQLGMDLESGWNGSIMKKFSEQTKELLALSTEVPIFPYFPVHPVRAKRKTNALTGAAYQFNELYDTFLDCFKAGGPTYFGVKCYPSLGYLPADRALAPIFKVCEDANIPVASHCGGEIISTFETRIDANEFGSAVTIQEGSRKANARRLNEPGNWRIVLEAFPNLRLNIGHFGGDSAWENSSDAPHPRISTVLELMQQHPNVYADFSFNLSNKRSSAIFAEYLDSTDPAYAKMKTRTMFGTDFWVVVPQSNLKKDQKNFISLTRNHQQRLFVDNVLSYLGIN